MAREHFSRGNKERFVRGSYEDKAGQKTGYVHGIRILRPGEPDPVFNRAGRRGKNRR